MDQEVAYVCVYVYVNVFQSVDTAGGLYHFGISEVRIRRALFEEVSNITPLGGCKLYAYYSHILDSI